jgi:hypothetical protein
MCCGDFLAKIFIFVVSAINLVLGVILFGVTIYLLVGVNIMQLVQVFSSNTLSYSVYAIFAVVVLFILVGICGIVGACLKKKFFLVIYVGLTVLCIIVTIVLGLMWVIYGATLVADAEKEMDKTLQKKYKSEYSTDAVSVGWNVVQVQLGTCGVDGLGDWNTSNWKASLNATDLRDWPATCCKDADKQVSLRNLIQNKVDSDSFTDPAFVTDCYVNMKVNTKGSKGELVPIISNALFIVGGGCIAAALFQILSILLACMLIKSKKFGKK